jgi:hypothetical protein
MSPASVEPTVAARAVQSNCHGAVPRSNRANFLTQHTSGASPEEEACWARAEHCHMRLPRTVLVAIRLDRSDGLPR